MGGVNNSEFFLILMSYFVALFIAALIIDTLRRMIFDPLIRRIADRAEKILPITLILYVVR